MSAFLTQPGALTGSMMEASRYLGTRLTRTGTLSHERAVRLQCTRAGWLHFWQVLAVSLPFPGTSFSFRRSRPRSCPVWTPISDRGPGAAHAWRIDRLLVKYGRVLPRSTAKANTGGSCEQCLTRSSGADCVWSQRVTSCGIGRWRGRCERVRMCRSMMPHRDSLPLRPSPRWQRMARHRSTRIRGFGSCAASVS